MMVKNFIGEKWANVDFDFEYTNDYRLEVSNYGRLKAYHKYAEGKLLNGSMVNGYKIIRLKFYTPREPKTETHLQVLQQQVFEFARKIKSMKQAHALISTDDPAYTEQQAEIEKAEKLIESLKKNLSKKFKDDLDGRVIHYHCLIHRLVAQYFCNKPSEEHEFVAHLDFDKLNNHYNNLMWMTREQNNAHRVKGPHNDRSHKDSKRSAIRNSKVAKLTITKVMLLKKMLKQGKPMRTLVKQFKITETQIRRIKKGENWADIEAVS